ncbi:MAG: RNA polymerase sigma factor [Candidatus Limnocylindria bacterium]
MVDELRAQRPEALDELLAAFGAEIEGVAYLILHSRSDAEEVVIDTAMTAWDKAATLRDASALRAWLMRVAARHALQRVRRARGIDPLPLLPTFQAASATGGADVLSDRLSLTAAVSDLPPRMRAAVALHYFSDLTIDDVAAALGSSRNTVKTELRLALRRLRVAMDANR